MEKVVLWRVVTRNAVFGLVFRNDELVEAPPAVSRHLFGAGVVEVREYMSRNYDGRMRKVEDENA